MRSARPSLWRPFACAVATDRRGASIAVTGELDLSTSRELEASVEAVIGDGFQSVVLDLRDVDFIDSNGLRAILNGVGAAQEQGARLVVLPPPADVARIFHATGTASRVFHQNGSAHP